MNHALTQVEMQWTVFIWKSEHFIEDLSSVLILCCTHYNCKPTQTRYVINLLLYVYHWYITKELILHKRIVHYTNDKCWKYEKWIKKFCADILPSQLWCLVSKNESSHVSLKHCRYKKGFWTRMGKAHLFNNVLQPILKCNGTSLHFSFFNLFPAKQNKPNNRQQALHIYLPPNLFL